MDLTAAQKATVLAYINSQAPLAALPNDPDSAAFIASALNAQASPNYWVWRTEVSVDEFIGGNIVWNAVDNLTVGKARIWEWMTRRGVFNPARANVRAGLTECFGAGSNNETRVFALSRRRARVIERLLATDGDGSAATPATMTAEGTIAYQEVQEIRGV